MSVFRHQTVLCSEAVDALNCQDGGIFVDGTLGGGGHAVEILNCISPTGKLIGIDLDDEAISAAGEKLSQRGNKILVKGNFADIDTILDKMGVERINGAIIDVGVSSHQLLEARRGFSFMQEAPLDMRMSADAELSAFEIVNTFSESELARIIKEYGEERMAKRIAREICRQREISPIETTTELAKLISPLVFSRHRVRGIHPATKSFQAVRIAVNDELNNLKTFLDKIIPRIVPGGRLAVISFHSLEDRIVKQTFVALASTCVCPRNMPICVCGKQALVKIITKKPIIASEQEVERNSSARSARLRVAERI